MKAQSWAFGGPGVAGVLMIIWVRRFVQIALRQLFRVTHKRHNGLITLITSAAQNGNAFSS